MKTMYSVPSCFAEPNLHPFPRTAHFTNIRRRFSIVSNCHHSFLSTECLWKRPRTHSHGPLMFLWVLSFWISWALTEEGVSVKGKPYSFKRKRRLFKNLGYSALWPTHSLIRILKRIHLKVGYRVLKSKVECKSVCTLERKKTKMEFMKIKHLHLGSSSNRRWSRCESSKVFH